MEVKVVAGELNKIETGALVIGLFEGGKPQGELAVIDKALDGAITLLINQGEIKGKRSEITLVHTLGKLPAARIVVVGMGKQKDMNLDKVRCAIAETLRFLRKRGVDNAAAILLGAGVAGITRETAAQALTEGALLGTYLFRQHMTKEPGWVEIKELSILSSSAISLPALEQVCNQGKILAGAANMARDMVNEPANHMTPSQMAEIATKLAETCGLSVNILEREQMKELGMGALLGVALGSQQPPKFIALRYTGNNTDNIDIALVGKGITFDSGGISIKPSEGMGDMKGDMAGGASVMAAISAIAQLKLKANVLAVVPATENMPSGTALKPGDIVTQMSGKTIEIISTDAEGRLILSDALGYARKLGAKQIIDVATLTGACRVALGDIRSGGFANNQELMDRVLKAGMEVGERIWQMPMDEEYKEHNKSDVADIKNSGGRYGGAIIAAQFLAEFAGDTPWVHLDIAGTNMTEKEKGYLVKGATGVPVRTLVNLVRSLAV